MSELQREIAATLGNDYRGEVLFDEMLARHTYLAIGGPADIYAVPADAMSLKKCLQFAYERKMPILVLGGGTNVLIADRGFPGLVVSLRYFNMKKIVNDRTDSVDIFVEAGLALQGLLSFCVERGYAGIEGLAGIPGTVGGAVAGNAGAHGQEIKDVVDSLIVMHHSGLIKKTERSRVPFGYRTSGLPGDTVVLSATMVFRKDSPSEVRDRMRQSLARKKERQPLAARSAGCVFRNPEGDFAGRLIESAGCKGLRVGAIEVSPVHANFLVNTGKGTAADFLALMDLVRQRVAERTGLTLEPEIRVVNHAD